MSMHLLTEGDVGLYRGWTFGGERLLAGAIGAHLQAMHSQRGTQMGCPAVQQTAQEESS